jgi:hypothetical protein
MGQGLRVNVIACAFEVLDLCAMRAEAVNEVAQSSNGSGRTLSWQFAVISGCYVNS